MRPLWWLASAFIGGLAVFLIPVPELAGTSADGPTPAPVAAGTSTHTPTPVDVAAMVGPFFASGSTQPHSCGGVVVHSPAHDTVLTAAHCNVMAGTLFAPGYRGGSTPYGVWTVEQTLVDSHWASAQDPHFDFAVLDLAPKTRDGRTVNVEDVTGATQLGTAPPAGQHDVIYAYPYGMNDQPVTCAVTVYVDNTYPAFDCHGYPDGTSGGPWILPATTTSPAKVVGVIGGYQRGGADEYTSYTSRFGVHLANLLTQAGAT